MSYIVFARKWRPQDFEAVVGQEYVTTTLKNAISLNRIAHAYLFAGPRGVGKTTVARIFARALNCEKGPTDKPCNKCISCREIMAGNSVDVLEIDGASNRGIDEIRSLRENIKFSPIAGKFKIYIIDEVHQITIDAFNALLKTLEEPPAHAKFIFATTQPHKVPATILSRCQRFDFKRIPVKLIIEKLSQIAHAEKIKIEDQALFAIARAAEGSMRDAEVLLDQINCASEGKISIKDVSEMLGVIEEDLVFDIAEKIQKNQTRELLLLLDRVIADGKDLGYLLNSLIEHFRSLLISKFVKTNLEDVLDLPPELLTAISRQSENFSPPELFYILQILTHTQDIAKRAVSVRVAIELAMIKLTERSQLVPIEEILNKINQLKDSIPPEKNVVTDVVKFSNPAPAGETKTQIKTPEVAQKQLPGESRQEHKRKINLEEVKAVWEKLIEEVQKYKMSYGIYLAEGKLLSVEDNVLTLGFASDKNLHKETLDKLLIRQAIESRLNVLLEVEIRLNFVGLKEETGQNAEPKAEAPEAFARESRPDVQTQSNSSKPNPMVEKALKIFGGKITQGTSE